MSSFLFGFLWPPAAGLCILLAGLLHRHFHRDCQQVKAMVRRSAFLQWRIQAVILIISAALGQEWPQFIGAVATGILSVILDDDMRKKGRKAAKLVGDKSRQILERLRESMTPDPLPGLSAVR